jgi:hypothetical protein
MHELIDTDPQAILAFGKLQAVGAIARTVPHRSSRGRHRCGPLERNLQSASHLRT